MTQTFGYYCCLCKKRFRSSLCADKKCPHGHSLKGEDSYYIYRKDWKDGIMIYIIGLNFKIDEYFEKKDGCSPQLREWVKKKSQEDPSRKEVYENVLMTWSVSTV